MSELLTDAVSSVAVPTMVGPLSDKSPTKLLRVMHVINGEHYSGAERVQDLLAACLPEEGFSVGFACLVPGKFGEMRQTQNAPLFEMPMRWRFDLRPARRLAKIVRDENYQLVHAHTPRSAMIGGIAARLAGVPFVYHVHSPTARDSTRRFQNWLNTKAEQWSIRRASRLITVSASLGRYMKQLGYAPEKIAVVPNGVPMAERQRTSEPPSGTWTLGTVALFRPRKGTEVLIEALARLRGAGHDARIRAVGPFETKEYEDDLKQRVRQLDLEDSVDWIGFTRDVGHELTKMDLFVLPSLFGEGLPMVVLEAMAAGVPVVATDIEGVPEAIRDETDGVIAAPNDPDDLQRAIEKVIDGRLNWSQLRMQATRRHAEQFSDRAMASLVAGCYREVLQLS